MTASLRPRVVIASEVRASRTADGAYWAAPGLGHDYWLHLLGERLPAAVVVRVEPAASPPARCERLDGELVHVLALPPLRLRASLPGDAARAVGVLWRRTPPGVLVVRLPGVVGSLVVLVAMLRRRRFAVQVVGDPVDVAFRAGVGGAPGKVAGVGLWLVQRLACRRALACSYVTERYLQRRYPPGANTFTLAISDVALPERPVPVGDGQRPVRRIVTVASLEQPYKRVDLLLGAVAQLRSEGWPLEVDVAGGGRLLGDLREQARRLGLEDHVRFHGTIAPDAVQRLLDGSDLFVLCSDTEGLPRALVEAMHAGLPCIGSDVGGVPELLPAEARFEAGSAASLVSTLRRFLSEPGLRARASAANRARAGDFSEHKLADARAAWRSAVLDGAA